MLEHERQREALKAALADRVSEPVLTAQWWMRAGLSGDDGLRLFKWIKRKTSGGDHPADRATGWNVLAVTPTRLVLFTGKPVRATPPVAIRDPLTSWPRADLVITERRHKAESYFFASNQRYATYLRRVSIEWPGDERPLVMDLPDDKLSREVLDELGAVKDRSRS